MIIDLDSWDAGYSDALLGCPSQCTASFDQVSYSSGYSQARASGGELRETLPSPAPRPETARRQPSANRHLKRSCFGEVIGACACRLVERTELSSAIGRQGREDFSSRKM